MSEFKHKEIGLKEGEDIKWIDGFEGVYAVTSLGHFYSYKSGSPKRLIGKIEKNGYRRYTLYDSGNITVTAHREVAKAFIGDVEGMEVDHINNQKDDNRVCNLDVVTPEENKRRAYKDRLYKVGESVVGSKLKKEDVVQIKILLRDTDKSCREIANEFDISRRTINQIKLNNSWRHVHV